MSTKRRAITIAVTIWAIALIVLFPVDSASAQYEPVLPDPFDCSTFPAPEVAIVGDIIIVDFSTNSDECVEEVLVQIDQILYRGPVPPNRQLGLPLPDVAPEFDTVITTVVMTDGTRMIVRTPIPSDGGSVPPPELPLTLDDPTAPLPPENGPQRRATPAPPLALTGAPISLQASIGAALIGGGGLLLLAARHSRSRGGPTSR